MENFENIQVPKIPTSPSHKINEDAFYFAGMNPPGFIPIPNSNAPKILKDTNIIVLEESIGYDGLWCKIKLPNIDQNGIGFVLQDKVVTLNASIPNSIVPNLNRIFLPDANAQEIVWREEPTERVFSDRKRAYYSILVDTGIQEIAGTTDQEKNNFILELMQQNLLIGLSSILKERGKRFDAAYVLELQNKYYKFGIAEAIDFSFRNCSTLRILVSIPMKYAESLELESSQLQTVQLPLTSGQTTTNQQLNIVPIEQAIEIPQNLPGRYVDLIFTEYEKFNDFFDEIALGPAFGALNVADVIFKSREWELEPSNININFAVEASNVELLKDEIDLFIIRNIPYNLANEALNITGPDALRRLSAVSAQVAKDQKTVGAAKATTQKFGALVGDLLETNWEGTLTVKIDRQNLKISYMEYKTTKGNKIPLNIGVFQFLESEIVKSKTSVNYLLQRLYSKIKLEYYRELNKRFEGQTPSDEQILAAGQDIRTSSAFTIYESVFKNPEFVNELNNIKPQTPVKDDFVDSMSIATFGGSPTDASSFFSSIGSMTANLFLVENNIQNFVLNYHYPKVTIIKARPLNLTNCISDNYATAKNLVTSKGPREIQKLKTFRLENIKKQRAREGSELLKSFEDYPKNISNRNLRIILGVDKPPKGTPFQVLNRYIIPAIKEININAILAEVIKCNSTNLDPATFSDLLNKYNKAKSLIESAAFATLCNPFLTAGLKKLNGFQLPNIPTYNPNKNLADELTNVIIKIIQDLLILSIRKILTDSIKSCVKDRNKERNPGADDSTDNLLDALQNAENDENINDVLDGLYNLAEPEGPQLNNLDGSLSPQRLESRKAAQEKLSDILDALLCLLTTKELCDLLNGFEVEAEVYEIVRNLVRRRQPDLADKLNTRDDIKQLFSRLGLSIDLKICDDVYNARNPIPANPLCDDGTLQSARQQFLKNKNLSDEAANAIIDDIKNQEAKNVEDILKFLDSDQPFDLDNLPSVLCKKAPDGSIIPPTVNLAPPLDSFKTLLNTLFAGTYDTFDKEAENWSKSTYSISSSNQFKGLTFNSETGKFDVERPSLPQGQQGKDVKNQKDILPAYLFNELLKKSENYIPSQGDSDFLAILDGDLQEKLDAGLIGEALKTNVTRANDNLRLFLGDFMSMLALGTSVGVINAGFNVAVRSSGGTNNLNNFEDSLREISTQLSLFDNFARSTAGSIEASPYNKFNKGEEEFLKNFGPNNEATSLLFEETGATLYLRIMKFLEEKEVSMKTVINSLDSALLGNASYVRNPNAQTVGQTLKTNLGQLINEYGRIKQYYKTVTNAGLNYPKYIFEFKDEYSNNTIRNVDSIHNVYKFSIKKNSDSINYINVENYEEYDSRITDYIKKSLSITNTNNPKKSIVLRTHINNIRANSASTSFDDTFKKIKQEIIKGIGTKIKSDSKFLQTITLSDSQRDTKKDENQEDVTINIDEIKKAKTDFLALVIPNSPTPQQKACGVRPHYLDIDSLRDEAIKNKESSLCTEEIVNDKVRNNLPINSQELETLESNDTQNIILLAVYRLALRVYLDDIVLRGIGVFGYFDAQILREDGVFIDYLAKTVESEILGTDRTFFSLMTGFFLKQYNLQNPVFPKEDTKKNRREVLKDAIKQELRGAVLAKLTKRIVDDTNNTIKLNVPESRIIGGNPHIKLNFINNAEDINNFLAGTKVSLIQGTGVVNLKYDNSLFPIFKGNLSDLNDTKIEFRLLFEYIFPLRRYISLFYISNALGTATRKSTMDVFRGTKSGVRKLAKIIQANGQPVIPDLNNPQDVLEAENGLDLFWFILEALLTTPIKIAKGLFEGIDPNVLLSSTIYKIGKAFDPDLTCFVVPGIGLPLGFLFFTPFMFNPLNLIYYGLGLWYEDDSSNDKNKADSQKRKFIDDLLNKAGTLEGINCEEVKDHNDVLKFNSLGYYVNPNIT